MLRPSGALATDCRSKEETKQQPKEAPVWCTSASQEGRSRQGKALTQGSLLLRCLMEVCPNCFLRQTDTVSIHDMEHSLNHTHFFHPGLLPAGQLHCQHPDGVCFRPFICKGDTRLGKSRTKGSSFLCSRMNAFGSSAGWGALVIMDGRGTEQSCRTSLCCMDRTGTDLQIPMPRNQKALLETSYSPAQLK